MKRTQLNLDEKTYYQLVSYAEREKTSLSGAARKLIAKHTEDDGFSTVGSLIKLVELGKKSKAKLPSNLSSNLDYYLYGEGSPKFGTKRK